MFQEIINLAFLTEKVAKEAILHAEKIIYSMKKKLPNPIGAHIVILVPCLNIAQDGDRKSDEISILLSNDQIEPHEVYSYDIGNKKKWKHNFRAIAMSKARQLWHGLNDGRTDCMPHLIFPGETPFWGGVKKDGIVVACSGFAPYFDKLFSSIIADICIALAYDYCEKAKKKNSNREFISVDDVIL